MIRSTKMNLLKPLAIALAATFAAGCASHEHVAEYRAPETNWTGPAGPQGSTGPTGAQGPLAREHGSVQWTLYRDFTFEGRSDDILRSDGDKARQIAEYMQQNPSFRIAIDGPNSGRVRSVVEALTDAGVPKYKIRTGNYGDPALNQNRRVAVLVSN